MQLIRNLILALGGVVMLFFAFTAGIFIFAILAVIGLGFAIWFKLRQKEIINKMEEMGMGREPQSPTIDGEYEVVDAEFEVLEEKKSEKD